SSGAFAGRWNVPRHSPSAPLVRCARAQSGCQSLAQPISVLSDPGTVTDVTTGSGGAGGSPTMPDVFATARFPEESFRTARYSRRVPFARWVTSWKTRYGALSSVPSKVHADVPTGR